MLTAPMTFIALLVDRLHPAFSHRSHSTRDRA
jgi:hypothetical protein